MDFPKVIFFGSGLFGTRVLSNLLEGQVPLQAIVTNEKEKRSEVQSFYREANLSIPLIFAPNISSESFQEELRKMKPQVFAVASFGQIFNSKMLQIPTIESINIHPSLLPFYRGAAPIQRSLMAGEKITGVTLIEMNNRIDAGRVIAQESITIDSCINYGQLADLLADLGSNILLHSLANISQISRTPQQETLDFVTSKVTSQEREINWKKSAYETHNQIRALSPKPGAWCHMHLGDRRYHLKILESSWTDKPSSPELNPFCIPCKSGGIYPLKVQMAGKKAISSKSWINGLQTPLRIDEMIFLPRR